ncbi:DUF3343 domain-containing protein [Romboutsia sp.]|uniref:DUF3343 domain-containing protein n=1 Tax=Romboutsia sp. TaxID=1965302 RepID=UPI003F2C61DC
MNEMYIVSFNSTHQAIRSDKLFEEINIKATTLPTPREITASCGISIRFLHKDLDNVNKVLKDNSIEYKGIYCISKLSDGKKDVKNIG